MSIKIPKYLMNPPEGWVDPHGLKRAAKVLDIQARRMRNNGKPDVEKAMREVSSALKKAAMKAGHRIAEGVSLGWEDQPE